MMPERTSIPSAEQNNCAIEHLLSGQVEQALHHLMVALSSVRIVVFEPCRGSSKHESSINVIGSALALVPQDSSFLFRYNRVLFIDTLVPCEDGLLVSAVILFNTAQVHHSIGIECEDMAILEQASRLYNTALVILESCKSSATRLLYLAILNNNAHVNSHLFRMVDVVDSLGKIHTLMTGLDHDANAFEEEDLILFTSNATFHQKIVFNLAPAA